MAFLASCILTLQSVLPISFREWDIVSEHIKHLIEGSQFLRLIQETFQVLFKLSGISEFSHNPIDLSMDSTLDVSIGPSRFPALASSNAALVTSFGS